MKYDISKQTTPKMPDLGRGTECIKILLSQASKSMHEPFVPMFFPVLGAHISGAEFQYPDNSWKELCGQMANLVAHSGDNKGQLAPLVEAICRDFRLHDKTEEDKYLEWQRLSKTEPGNKKKTAEPIIAYRFPPANTTSAGFLKNAIALEAQGGLTQYFNLPEVEMADKLCGGHKEVSVLLRNVYDRARAGALRATADGVTGNPIIRACFTISSNPDSTRKFYKYELTNGTFGRMVFSYKPRGNREGKIPRQGKYDDEFYKKLDEYIARLDLCKGRYIIRPLNKLIDRLAQDMATLADLADDDVLFEVSHRSLVSGWKAGCVLWVLNKQTWTKPMGELVEWLVYHDLWSKMQVFGDMLNRDADPLCEAQRRGPKNMLDKLPDTFNEAQLEALRLQYGKSSEGTRSQINKWVFRKFITYSNQTGLYTKTDEYLKGNG
ncbi:MAG: hypothetical protein II487_06505 [Schwartzia sp.]|nr:hypothetical protein [Schwartzia sp. (in: firmicutes)]